MSSRVGKFRRTPSPAPDEYPLEYPSPHSLGEPILFSPHPVSLSELRWSARFSIHMVSSVKGNGKVGEGLVGWKANQEKMNMHGIRYQGEG